MDQHPIPQDVTGFQFKLIGTMTVKQFGFVAVGVVMAFILYYVPAQGIFLILLKWTLIPLFGIGGIVIAFVPIEGRPVDVMARNFFKAIFSPNQYAYKRTGRKMSFSHVADAKAAADAAAQAAAKKAAPKEKVKPEQIQKEEKLRALLYGTGPARSSLDQKESAFLSNISTVAAPVKPPPPPPPPSPMATSGIPPAAKNLTDSFIHKLNPATSTPPVTAPAPTATPTPVTQQAMPAQIHAPAAPPSTSSASNAATAGPTAPTQATPAPASLSASPQQKDEELIQKEALLEKELTVAKQEDAKNPSTDTAPSETHKKVLDLEQQIQEVHDQKQKLEEEIAKLKDQLLAQQAAPSAGPSAEDLRPAATPAAQPAPIQAPPGARIDAQHVRAVPQTITKSVGLPHVSDTPNVVVGIVKDPRGNVLPGILIEVKDKDNNPVRAFKTNPLGQFASATPLAAGTYTIVLEDPKKTHSFDVVQVVANDQIMMPIEVISHDAREELRKQLFN